MPHDLFGLPLLGEEYCKELEQMVPCLDLNRRLATLVL
ncbi:hypothetical protein ALQ98_200020 [Pseudomonas syringae pv. lapsa]|uniref:Uncharacterized protein n=1 Tax=Pseudomonas syringae pv. lapsa TaxID=199201 RepID=A0AB74A3S1_PSESX|nr:hypothetical protein ALQ98_200020 [Pseudomonas syringae pv. lapsa]